MTPTSNVLALLAFFVVPVLLVGCVTLDALRALQARVAVRRVLARVREATRLLYVERDASMAELEVNRLPDLVAASGALRSLSTLTQMFAAACQLVLHAEYHRRDPSTDPEYVSKAAALFAAVHDAMSQGDALEVAEAVGQLLALDVLDRQSMAAGENRAPAYQRASRAAVDPLLLVGLALRAGAEALESGDTDLAKICIENEIERLAKIVPSEQLGLPLLVLHWARLYLYHVSDVRPAGTWLFWKSPEEVVVRLLQDAAVAAQRGDRDAVVRIIATSRDAYRTPRL